MYKHPETRDEEYPKTAREILNHSLEILAEKYPDRSLELKMYPLPAYDWPGAGSEKGGSAEHIIYETLVFAPAQKDKVLAISVGNKHVEWLDYSGIGKYSLLFRQVIPTDLAELILNYYNSNIKDKNEESEQYSEFKWAVSRLLQEGTTHFRGASIFAFDEAGREHNAGFFFKNYSFLQWIGNAFRHKDLEPITSWFWEMNGSLENRKEFSKFIAECAEGKKSLPELLNFKNVRGIYESTAKDISATLIFHNFLDL